MEWIMEEYKFPTYAEAKEIVDNAEVVNPGTPYEFVRGCFSTRYKDAELRLSMTWLSEDE
jgi:hypothetical protein